MAKADPSFQAELDRLLKHFAGRPSPLYFADGLTETLGGAKSISSATSSMHTGAHKINNVLGRSCSPPDGQRRIIAETGAGQHGVATATTCAASASRASSTSARSTVERREAERLRMEILGAGCGRYGRRPHAEDAMNEALRDWVTNVADTFYCIGTAAGPRPYPVIVRDFRCVIGDATRARMMGSRYLPDSLRRRDRRRLERHRPSPSLP